MGAPVLLHPRAPDLAVRAAYYSGFRPEVDAAFATYGLGWHYDAGVQFLRLVLSGTFDRMPGLQVILGHWGELVLFYAERLAAMDRVSGLAHPIATYLRRNPLCHGERHVPSRLSRPRRRGRRHGSPSVLDRLSPTSIVPGATPRRFLERCDLGEAAKAAFAHGNWLHLVGKGAGQTGGH